MFKYDHLEMARIIGEPIDPRRRYTDLETAVCVTDVAEPNDYHYYYDVIQDTDTIYTITSAGSVTTTAVSADTPTALTFADYASPEYYIKLTELASSKEKAMARKVKTINRAMNAFENYQIIQVIDAAASGQGNVNDLKSGETSYNYAHVIDQIDQVIDYSENYVLIAGTQIDKDIKLWDWTDSYESLLSVMVESKFGYIGKSPNEQDEGNSEERLAQARIRRDYTPSFSFSAN